MPPFRIKSILPQLSTTSVFPLRQPVLITPSPGLQLFMAFSYITTKSVILQYQGTPTYKIIKNSGNYIHRAFAFSCVSLSNLPVLISFFGIDAGTLTIPEVKSRYGIVLQPERPICPIYFSGDIVLATGETLVSELGLEPPIEPENINIAVSMFTFEKQEVILIE